MSSPSEEAPGGYYGRPVLKEPVWTWEIPCYFFVGGLAGAAAPFALMCELRGDDELARRAWLVAFAGIAAAPPLLIADLGRSERFFNMLRLFKPSSPMSVGSWVLAFAGGCFTLATTRAVVGWPRRLGALGAVLSGVLGPALATYTAVLLADTAVPVWHEARGELPFVFAGSAAASAGAAVALVSPVAIAGPARRMAVFGALVEESAVWRMRQRLAAVGDVYDEDREVRWFSRAAQALTAVGAGALVLGGRRRRGVAGAGAVAVLAGSLCQRWAVFKAGFASARQV